MPPINPFRYVNEASYKNVFKVFSHRITLRDRRRYLLICALFLRKIYSCLHLFLWLADCLFQVYRRHNILLLKQNMFFKKSVKYFSLTNFKIFRYIYLYTSISFNAFFNKWTMLIL